ncbi:MAG TPA: PD-(D/E)XK nuclease family protein, partial [Thermoleophilaceae bacterium]|nr:PD-(D/E)XK nuclease family protein [Thermoleophilaceae bacterium]
EPEYLELSFGFDGSKPVEIADGVSVRGKIDRVDVWNGHALVRDYKSGKNATDYKVSSWDKANRFQVALYMIAAQEKLGLEPAGGVYMFLGGDERRGRGMVASDVDGLGDNFFDGDRRGPEEFSQMLDWARGRITDAAGRMRRGELACKPDSCGWRGGCSHPSVCRIET